MIQRCRRGILESAARAAGTDQFAAAIDVPRMLRDAMINTLPCGSSNRLWQGPAEQATVVPELALHLSQQHRRCLVDGCHWLKSADNVW